MAKGQIFKSHTLKEYQEKYGKYENLLQFTKEEVSSFDKGNEGRKISQELGKEYSNYLLADRSWWLIGNTYYEVPVKVKGAKHVHVSTHTCKCPINFGWFKEHKKKAIIIGCVVAGTCGLLAGGHYLTAYLLENRSIRQKLGGASVSFDEALELATKFEEDIQITDYLDIDAKLKAFEISGGSIKVYESGETKESLPFNFNWSGVHYNNKISYRDVSDIVELVLKKSYSDVAEEINTEVSNYKSSSTKGLISMIGQMVFHQAYTPLVTFVNEKFGQAEGIIDLTYLNDKGKLGFCVTIPDLTKILQGSTNGLSVTGQGSLEIGVKTDDKGFIQRILVDVHGDNIKYSKGDKVDGVEIDGKFNIKADVNVTSRTLAKPITVNFYVNGKEYAKGQDIEIYDTLVIDPFYVDQQKGSGAIVKDATIGYTNRTYRTYFETKDDTIKFDSTSSSIFINGHDYTQSSYGKLAYFGSDDQGDYVEIDRTIMSENYTYNINLVTQE